MREAERLTTLQQPGFTDAMGLGTGVDIGGIIAAAAISEAFDSVLLTAYQRTDGDRATRRLTLWWRRSSGGASKCSPRVGAG